MRILIITAVPFWRGATGADGRIAALTRWLRRQGDARVLYLGRVSALAERSGDIVPLETPARWLTAIRRTRRKLGSFLPARVANVFDDRLEDRLAARRCCKRWRPDTVIVEYAHLAGAIHGLRERFPGMRILVDTHDAMAPRTRRFQEQGIAVELPVSEAMEARWLSAFDAIIAIQEEEAVYFRRIAPGIPVVTAGHPQPVNPLPQAPEAPVTLLFPGSAARHNLDAVHGLLEHVWPGLHDRFGDAVRFDIAGDICHFLEGKALPPGVRLRGFLAGLDALYGPAHIVFNPAFTGSGLRIKNIEALCCGRCLITTPLGAHGFPPPAPMRVCDSWDAIRDAAAALIENPGERNTLEKTALVYAAAHFSEEAVYEELRRWLRRNSEKP